MTQTASAAILSVSDKTGLVPLAQALSNTGVTLYASGGTYKLLKTSDIPVKEVSELTNAPEMLGGRVKTLHPAVHGGILARSDLESDAADMLQRGYQYIDYVVCNLYPFEKCISKENVSIGEAVEEVDIGGVTLLRAAAKNHARVSVVCDPKDYESLIQALARDGKVDDQVRKQLAVKAFEHTAQYDGTISGFFRSQYAGDGQKSLKLRYGMNPNQTNASVCTVDGQPLPIKVLNGSPGFINLCDALNAYPLVSELHKATGVVAAASFKHVSPAGAAIGLPLSDDERIVMQVEGSELTPMAAAYARARGSDRMSSFGDWVALSGKCDLATAKLISREVSDGIIAIDYDLSALELLKAKKNGKYCVLQMDPNYVPATQEQRQIYGLTLEQKRNDAITNVELLASYEVPSTNKQLSDQAKQDIVVALTTLKFTQSNSVAFAHNGMVVGLGAGQQSRIHCTRLAGSKADCFWLRFHPKVLSLKFKQGVRRADKANAIDLLVSGELDNEPLDSVEVQEWQDKFEVVPAFFTVAERREWLQKRTGVVCASDAFFPFADNIHRCQKSGVSYVVAPGGSVQDAQVLAVADGYGMTVVRSPFRLFHH